MGLRPLFGESWGLSYFGNRRWWAIKGSNLESSGYEPAAITITLMAQLRAFAYLHHLSTLAVYLFTQAVYLIPFTTASESCKHSASNV